MSKFTAGILGAIALSLSFGAAQFALGRDLPEPQEPAGGINRAAKADRIANVTGSAAQTQTISVRLEGFVHTSFLVRIPAVKATEESSSRPVTKPVARKPMVACEPVVSLLTEVAKLLQPGRCVT